MPRDVRVHMYSPPADHLHIYVHKVGDSGGDARSRSRSPPGAYAVPDGATEPEEFAEEEAPEEFQVTVRKETPGSKLGVSAQRKHHPPEFKIVAIGEGLVRQWNEENPTETVMPGDTIFEVNGVNSSTEAMCDQIANAQLLVLKIRLRIEQW